MLRTLSYAAIIISTFLFVGCIDFYKATPEEAMRTILVVDGYITDDTTVIHLSQSVLISNYQLDETGFPKVNDARVRVERSDGVFFDALADVEEGEYKIVTGDLDPDLEYRLKVVYKGNTYVSDFLAPLMTPEIADFAFTKNPESRMISATVTTPHSGQSDYYQWSWEEIWEIVSIMDPIVAYDQNGTLVPYDGTKHYCWKYAQSRSFNLGNYFPKMGDDTKLILFSFPCADDRLERIYWVKVRQNLVSKEYYDYSTRLIKNADLEAAIFSPIPSELAGNIRCESDPSVNVIGYVEASVATTLEMFITQPNDLYEDPHMGCRKIYKSDCVPGGAGLLGPHELKRYVPDDIWSYPLFHPIRDSIIEEIQKAPRWDTVRLSMAIYDIVEERARKYYLRGEGEPKVGPDTVFCTSYCLDCTKRGGRKTKPEWWPNDHY